MNKRPSNEEIYRKFFQRDGPVWIACQKAYWIKYEEIQDIMHDIYLIVVKANFRGEAKFSTFVNRITWYHLITVRDEKGKMSLVKIPESMPAPLPAPDEGLELQELLDQVLGMAWSEKSAKMLQLYCLELIGELVRQDVADELGLPMKKASQALYDIAFQFRRRYKSYDRKTGTWNMAQAVQPGHDSPGG